jgi:hypothetical protein
MSGEIQILLVVLLSVTVGAVALIYYLRKREGPSSAEPAPYSQDTTTLDRDPTTLPGEQELPPLSGSLSSDEAAATPHGSDEEVEQGAVGLGERKDNATADEPEPRAEPGPRPDERTEHRDLIDTPQADVVTAPAVAEHKERVTGDGRETETTPSQVDSDTTSTPDIAEGTKEGAPAVDLDAAVSNSPETDAHQSGAGLHVLSGAPAPGAETAEAAGEDTVEQPRINDDHLPAGAGDEQAHLLAGSATCPASSEEPIPADVSAVSAEDVTATERLDKDQPALEEQPSRSPGEDEALGLADREASAPEPSLDVLAGDEASCAVRGLREAEDPDASPEEGEVAEDLDASQDEQRPGQVTEERGFDTEEEYDELDADSATIARPSQEKPARRKKPRKYKGLGRVAPQPRDATPQPVRPGGEESAQRERSLPIEVRLRFDRGGFCSVSLIPKRSPALPEDLTAATPAGEVVLRAMQDEWYQDVVPEDISRVLRDGAVWTNEGLSGQCTWSLSGRTLYVLGDRSDISGYVSQPCLDLGRDHVVLCSDSLRRQVEDAIRQTGAQPTTVLDESFGAPPGWLVFRGVVPNAPVAPAGEADIFNALRPLPRIEISLERGIRLGYANWLDGHPPLIRVYGDPAHAAEVRIDGQVATRGSDGTYRVPGWDFLGSHTVWCSGTSKSYSILPFDASWDLWEGYAFPVGPGETRRLTICGPIVRAAATETGGAEASILVSETNPVLLGPEPGQIVMAVRASSLRGAPCIASPPFRPVWALPRDPLHCDKRAIRILFVAGTHGAMGPKEPGGGQNIGAGVDVGSWCRFILDASRKGMKTDPDTDSVRALWFSYKHRARHIWRSRP